MSPLTFLQALVDRGMSYQDAVDMARAFEVSIEEAVSAATAPKRRSANAERQARFRARKALENENETNNVTGNVTSNAERDVTAAPRSLDKEIPPTPPKEINPPAPENTLSHPARERVDVARQRLEEVRAAAGDALACMATTLGVSSTATLTALLEETPPCDWHLDVLPAVTAAAAWHRQRDGTGGMKTWTLAARLARENRNRRLNPPPVEPARVRPSAHSGPDPRSAARLERFEAYEDASRAALRKNTS